MGVVTIGNCLYPNLLAEIYKAPDKLYVRGDVSLLHTKMVAVIGSRIPTDAAINQTKCVVKKLVELGFTIVSGCAKGIDSLAQSEAIRNGGKTIGVLGFGHNFQYPSSSRTLFTALENQLTISEYAADVPIAKFRFIERNRIISGLCKSVIVIQSTSKSGSFITAQMALNENREVYVIPGIGFSEAYLGSHQLISEGANVLYDLEQLARLKDLL